MLFRQILKFKMNQPEYVYSPGVNNWASNQQLLKTVSPKSQFVRPIFVTGSSHVKKDQFTTELKSQFFKGMPRKNSVISFGGSWGYPGGRLETFWIREQIFKKVQAISQHPDYNGMVLVIMIGTNDASCIYTAEELDIFEKIYREFCLRLLNNIPKIFLMPCALLPRREQERRPEAEANMFYANEVVRDVCLEIRSMTQFSQSIKFTDINHGLAEVEFLPDEDNFDRHLIPTLIPLDDMVSESDNVHLTEEGYKVMVSNILKTVNFIPGEDLGLPPVKQNSAKRFKQSKD